MSNDIHQGHAGEAAPMRHHVKVARCNCGAMNVWPDGCHYWTAVCTCGWSDLDADHQPGGIEAAYWHMAHRMILEDVLDRDRAAETYDEKEDQWESKI